MAYPETRKTRVAVISNGVSISGKKQRKKSSSITAASCDLMKQVIEGISFLPDNREDSPWWSASSPEGTWMAKLICSIDPCCDLYIVKVTELAPPDLRFDAGCVAEVGFSSVSV